MPEKVEFASLEWIAVARQTILQLSEGFDFGELSTSFCEEFTDPPAHLSMDGSSLGWHIVVHGGSVVVEAGVLESADVMITVPYQKALWFARLTNAEAEADGPARDKFRRESVRVTGDIKAFRALELPWSGKLHDILAAMTA